MAAFLSRPLWQVLAVRDETLQAARASVRAAASTLSAADNEAHERLSGAHGRAAAWEQAHKLGIAVSECAAPRL